MSRENTTNVGTEALPFYHGDPHTCPYLPDRFEEDVFTFDVAVSPPVYLRLMERGFRRSGMVIYRPECDGCRECVSIRVPVEGFVASRSQRRVLRRNADIRVETGPPVCTDEKWRIFVEYLRFQHDGSMSDDREDFERFLYLSPTETLEMVYFAGRRMVGAGIVDVTPAGMSSVYFYFDPAVARRSLGVFGGLREIEECRRRGLAHWYVGYYIRECRQMNYKAAFRPFELLGPDGCWRRFRDESAAGAGGAG